MRQIILDTETTGLDPRQGHRIIEIAGLELVDRRPTGRHVHLYLNPDREIDAGATEVHGMTWDDLRDKPRFRDVAGELCEFLRGAQWVIHNAPFDLGFLDPEFGLCEVPPSAAVHAGVVDTLVVAREQFPGKRNTLDALCERFGVDHAERTLAEQPPPGRARAHQPATDTAGRYRAAGGAAWRRTNCSIDTVYSPVRASWRRQEAVG